MFTSAQKSMDELFRCESRIGITIRVFVATLIQNVLYSASPAVKMGDIAWTIAVHSCAVNFTLKKSTEQILGVMGHELSL